MIEIWEWIECCLIHGEWVACDGECELCGCRGRLHVTVNCVCVCVCVEGMCQWRSITGSGCQVQARSCYTRAYSVVLVWRWWQPAEWYGVTYVSWSLDECVVVLSGAQLTLTQLFSRWVSCLLIISSRTPMTRPSHTFRSLLIACDDYYVTTSSSLISNNWMVTPASPSCSYDFWPHT